MHDDRKGDDPASEAYCEHARCKRPTPRSGWFNDETLQIQAPKANAGQSRLRSISKALGDGVRRLLGVSR